MKANVKPSGALRKITSFIVLFMILHLYSYGQGITVYQYRHVPDDKISEFINRETTYWSVVAEKAMEKGNLSWWALLEKVGGYDLPNSSNFLFINTYNDIDNAGSVWNPSAVFPGVAAEKMETGSMSTVTSNFFLRTEHWEQAAEAQPDDFQYVVMVYHNASDPGQLIQLEKTHWAPFIKGAMDKKQTTMSGWGNASVLSPFGDDIKFNTVSYDVYPSLKEALSPTWQDATVFPETGLSGIAALELNRRGSVVYRIVKVVTPNN